MSFLTSRASPSLCGPDFFPSIIFQDCAPLAIPSTTCLASSPQPANKLKSWKSLKNKRIFPFQLPSYFLVFPFTDHIESVICIVVSTTQFPSALSPLQYGSSQTPMKHRHWVTNSTTATNLTSCMSKLVKHNTLAYFFPSFPQHYSQKHGGHPQGILSTAYQSWILHKKSPRQKMKSLYPRLETRTLSSLLATKLLYDFILTTVVLKSASSSAGLRINIRVRELNPPFGHNPPKSLPSRPSVYRVPKDCLF